MNISVAGTNVFLRGPKSTIFESTFNWNKFFRKSKLVSGQTPFVVVGPFCTLFVLTLAFDREVLHGNFARSIVVISTRNSTPLLF